MVVVHEFNELEHPSAPVAWILPGAGYTAHAPLLYWSAVAQAAADWHVFALDWHDELDDALRGAPLMQLAIGGSADPAWWPEFVSGTAAELITVSAADHSLELVDADRRASMLLQIEIIDRVAAHAECARLPLAGSALRILKECPCSLNGRGSAMPATSAGSP